MENGSERIRVASYCRVSTDREDQANSFASQQRFFREYIERQPLWELYESYSDEGISGTGTQNRAGFSRMIRDALQGRFRMIVTKEISRFSRNILDTIQYTRQLKAAGVGVLFLTENLNTLLPETEMLLTFMGTLAQEESRRTSVRVKWGQTRRMEQGIVFGRSLLGYHVEGGHISVEPKGAETVKRIFAWYGIEKESAAAIAAKLNAENAEGRVWNAGAVLRILKNEKYKGDLVQKKTITTDYLTHRKKKNDGEEAQIVLCGHHEAIVDGELWESVQNEIRGRRRRDAKPDAAASRKYGFSGRIRCGVCGKTFLARYRKEKSGTGYRRWICASAVGGGRAACGVGCTLREDEVRDMLRTVLSALEDRLAPAVGEALAILHRIQSGEQPAIRKEMERLTEKRLRTAEAVMEGLLDAEEARRLQDAYRRKRDALSRKLKELEDHGSGKDAGEEAVCRAMTEILLGERESDAFCRQVLEKITVYSDKRCEVRLQGLQHGFWFALSGGK